MLVHRIHDPLMVTCIFVVISFTICYVLGDPGYSTNATIPAGSARQRFGSSSLRAAAKKSKSKEERRTVFATGKRLYEARSTYRPHIMLPEYPDFPLPLPYHAFAPFTEARPRYTSDDGRDIVNRGGVLVNGMYPPLNFNPDISNWGEVPGGGYSEAYQTLVPDPYPYGTCSLICREGYMLCSEDCKCIKDELRCDGHQDCGNNEDEMFCKDIEPPGQCEKNTNFIACPGTRRCISKDWLCDGDDDCGDYSDETRCGLPANCSSEYEFQCDNGLCVQKNWRCDNENDCRDFSDELNCTKGCDFNEFQCSDGTCINAIWRCDRSLDCMDGSDEINCDLLPNVCTPKEFRCSNGMCIKLDFRCDGDDDCEDWSDEDNCPKKSGYCGAGEFSCKNGDCIPNRWLCDSQKDCSNEEDEADCRNLSNKTCNADEFRCASGQCILKSWMCDGVADCPTGEDENKCSIVCDDAKFACSAIEPNKSHTAFCIDRKRKCDGRKDCPKGDDEMNCPIRRTCVTRTICEHVCVTRGGKKGCDCHTGFKLHVDGSSCLDIDECMYATDPVCAQTCNNTIGSYTCGCMTGYQLRPDLRTCKAIGYHPTLLFANRVDIRQMSLSNSKYSLIVKGLHNAISLDYHYRQRFIYWSDVSTDKIKRVPMGDVTKVETIISYGLESPGGIALDWVHKLLFWTDSGTKRIEVANMNGSIRATIIANDVDKPRAIAVHPGEAWVFWSDWGPEPKIERCEMDGTNRRKVATQSVFWPNGLTIDYADNRLYWADAKHNVIEVAAMDGTKRKKLITKGLPHPFGISIFEDAIFWTDWHTKSINTANKRTGAGVKMLHSKLHFPMDVRTFHIQRQPMFSDRCGGDNGHCADLCLPTRKSFTCRCRLGQEEHNRDCRSHRTFMFFTKKRDIRLLHIDRLNPYKVDVVIPLENIKNAAGLAFDYMSNYIFWTDLSSKTINRAQWDGSNHVVLASTNIFYPKGLAFDYNAAVLYWTDTDAARIEISDSDGKFRTVLIWENLEKPGDITVDPLSGLMFWADWGREIRIENAFMDGSNRKKLVYKDLSDPSGLTVDLPTSKLYWTDSILSRISLINLDGTGRKVLLSGPGTPKPYALDIYDGYIYWADWKNKTIEKADKRTGKNRTVIVKNVADVMSIKLFYEYYRAPMVNSPCVISAECSHLCILKQSVTLEHTCTCPTGIKLMEDNETCSNGPLNYLIVAHRMEIRQISLDVPYMADVVLPIDKLKVATSVDVDRKTGEIYWTDTAEESIQKAYPNGTNRTTVLSTEIKAPDGIAIDSTGRKIYWTDGERNSIEVSELDGTNRKVLFNRNIYNPRAITLHYHHGLMFWSDWGKEHPKIEVANMDGRNRKVLISQNITWPNGLAIDRAEGRLYWNDAKRKTIESCKFDGTKRWLIMTGIQHPYGLVVVGSHIYWTDWKERGLFRADKDTGHYRTNILVGLDGLMDVRSVQYDNIAENACGDNNGGCSHLCLRNPIGYTCACPTGLTLSKAEPKQCVSPPRAFLLVGAKNSLIQINFDNDNDAAWDITLPVKDNMENVIDIDFHYKKKFIFYSDIKRNMIQRVDMTNLSDVRTVVRKNLSSPDGISVDWLADNIYWTNTGNKSIEVARLDGSHRKTILSELDDPRSLACNPKGFLFWSDWDRVHPRIERCHLDGTERKPIVTEGVAFPIGLTIDFAQRLLYWVDAKLLNERIESCDFHGHTRSTLEIQKTLPFSLAQYREWLYWTDWDQNCIMRAEKTKGRQKAVLRSLRSVTGIAMVGEERQLYWNPCAVNNGNCTHLCFYKRTAYTCGCPDQVAEDCKTEPDFPVSKVCPEHQGYDCPVMGDTDYDDDDGLDHFREPTSLDNNFVVDKSSTFHIITLITLFVLVIISVMVATFILVKQGKKTYTYGATRSFSNPNYYSNDPNAPQNPPDRRQFIWKRLKYDKSQERVYEETVVASPEVTSLIPTILTPCSSHCETVTPEIERSPSVTPLRQVEIQ